VRAAQAKKVIRNWGKTFFEKKGASRTGKNAPKPPFQKTLTMSVYHISAAQKVIYFIINDTLIAN